ncbi:MAG: hypothetical protein BGP10_03465 [Rhodanobacter sp. 68-29]|uniref:DUF3501 family protein n=1 Tax=Rhodanobacter sp. PCA2 TaxID=2006117 RepID=UPI00086945AE|nr:DUF3501 family protein [Rhodanobacter sp. PCA2]MBA2077695.1 hypothetical protein [Rhodanobacter sp. PCA2]MBN8924202.1 DUF3501 family protein [Rhodanobacter sp.]ODU73351.1 MAG: hypothetical protein ABT17_12500 [Rhodanobacter sp. SCN 69-32]OJY57628.1 MAG: hypothetical protein BGP10_03465 [Rhodanobacter sp. 68-29]
MDKLERGDLLSLENYALERIEFRARVMAHKKQRTAHLGGHLTLIFEDRLSIQYQVQEMLRIERIFEPAGIQDELDAYNPLIPDGDNLKATLLIEYDDVEERKRELVRLRNIEHAIALTVAGHAPAVAVADEDMERSNDEKTAAVHFLRFPLDADRIAAWKAGAAVTLACTLPALPVAMPLSPEQCRVLATDFD